MLDFGYADAAYINPHGYINGTDTLVTFDGINKCVGIGSTNPVYKLDVNGTVNSTGFRVGGDGGITFSGSSTCQIYTTPSDAYNPSSSANNMIIRSWWGIGFSDYGNTVRITMDTRTGSAQFNGGIVITGYTTQTYSLYEYFYAYSRILQYPDGALQTNAAVGLKSAYSIIGGGVIAIYSDQRIKKNIQPVSSMLPVIDQIEVVSFDMIDSIGNPRNECGVIAQQVEQVFPNAVDRTQGIIPCYMTHAISQQEVEGEVHILFSYDPLNKDQTFKEGDKIKLVLATSQENGNPKDKDIDNIVVVKRVLMNGFVTDKWKDYDSTDLVFVYGKEVPDLRHVDQEQLGVLGLRGVQELHQIIKTQQQTIDQQQKTIDALLAWATKQGFQPSAV